MVPIDRRLGCMMHVRRRFHDALKLGDKRAGKAVTWIAELYEVEQKARGLSVEERLAMRRQFSLPRLDELVLAFTNASGLLPTTRRPTGLSRTG